MLRDLLAGKLRSTQFSQASNQFWKIVQVLKPLDPPSGLMFGDVASDPANANRQPITLFVRCHQHLLHDDSNDLLLVNRLSCRSMPQRGKVFRQLAELLKLGRRRYLRLRLVKSAVLFFELAQREQCLIPPLLKCPSHQSIFRLDRLILPFDPLGRQPRTFQTLLPVALDSGTITQHFLGGGEAQFDGPRSQGTQYLRGDRLVQFLAKKLVAAFDVRWAD